MSTTVEALKRSQDVMSTTVDALKLGLDKERIAALEQRLHEMNKNILKITSLYSFFLPDQCFPASCPKAGYTVFRGICYKAFNTTKTFSDAAAACGKDGGTLAMPRDAEIDAFLISLYKSVSDRGKFWWFGLHDQREEGSFEWVDGSTLTAPGLRNNQTTMGEAKIAFIIPHTGQQKKSGTTPVAPRCFTLYARLSQDVRRRQAELSPPLYSGSPTIRSKTDQQNVKPGNVATEKSRT
ncbi:uncharacterized protein LOC144880233 [Branchiostoma floridae x Branchiostoma japonicum]